MQILLGDNYYLDVLGSIIILAYTVSVVIIETRSPVVSNRQLLDQLLEIKKILQ